jgi:hypothetical protein
MRSPARNGTVPSQLMGAPLNAISTSPRRSAAAPGAVGSTRVTSTPLCLGPMPRLARSAGASSGCHSKPTAGKPVNAPLRAKSARKCAITGVGMMNPTFSASPSLRLWNAMPTHSPSSFKTGPPLLPPLMAASIWTPSSSEVPCT